MKLLDRLLQRWRIAKALPFIPRGARVLDVGCGDGALFRLLGNRIHQGLGIDPMLAAPVREERYALLPGRFPEDLPGTGPFDAITLFAVLEHIPPAQQRPLAEGCARLLKPGGFLVVTSPARRVDRLLRLLFFLRLIDGMSLAEHYGFDPRQTPAVFSLPGLDLVKRATFQLGLNHLFVFRKKQNDTISEGRLVA